LSKQDPIRCVHSTDKSYRLEYIDGSAVEPKFEAELNLKPQPEWGRKWEHTPILWKNLHDTADIEGQYYERRLMNLTILAWEWKTKWDVREARVGEPPDIRNTWGNKETDNLFKERPSTLYYAFFPGQGSISGKMKGNDDYLWGTAPGLRPIETGEQEKIYDLQHTLSHELGHIAGLRHEANFSDHIMWPRYNEQRIPQPNDIYRLQQIYGRKIISPWKELWIRIRLARGVKKRII